MTMADPAAMMAAIAERRSALIAQCPAPPPTPSAEELRANPIRIIEVGTSGPSAIFIHGGVQGGLGGGPGTFDRQRVLAEKGWRLRLIERPGFGQSPSRGVDDMEAEAEWIAEMLGEGSHLIGHSWGGADALLAAARRPAAVQSLTLIEPALFPIVMSDPELRADPEMQMVGGRMAGLVLQSETPADYAIAFKRTVMGLPDDPGIQDRIAGLEAHREAAERLGCALLLGKMASPEAMRAAADTVAAHKIPVLVISGGWSAFFDQVGEVVARFTNGRFETVRARNHMVQLANPEAFNRLLNGFMRDADSAVS
ncbi:pimeloyl-ACP methyl ester carboxylesterase [Sphingomonas vulcanisoli]|uniref:Pimeloyl-ACP methyl ester carboxylesterase n=1 Tax=Sphingomonas vulcanisoli TaxID=1658060 RepID=A0ABX0TYN7_9SPHN|nr:alpha/beta hydrolase [Sphingomonas vulcanisoli]NIJ09495.1 pimeloyl-ACP methyl ester carboxylesterase [Sphingomonas vulcanisoli]